MKYLLMALGLFILIIVASILFYNADERDETEILLEQARLEEQQMLDNINYQNAILFNDPGYCENIETRRLQRDCFRNFE